MLATHDLAELLDGEERQLASFARNSGFCRAARTRLFGLLNKPNRDPRAPQPIATSLLLF